MFDYFNLVKLRRKLQKKLSDSNLELFKSMSDYLKHSFLSRYEQEEILQQVMDMLLEAQLEEKPLSQVIGPDHEAFCDQIIEEYVKPKNTAYKVLAYIEEYLMWIMFYIIVFTLVVLIQKKSFNNVYLPGDALIMINGMAILFTAIKTEKRSLRTEQIYKKIKFKYYEYKSSKHLLACLIYFIASILPMVIGFSQIYDYNLHLFGILKASASSLAGIILIEIYKMNYKKNRLRNGLPY